MKITLHCPRCGSEDITRDGLLRWCVDAQAWEAAGELDAMNCDACDAEFYGAEERAAIAKAEG